MQHVLQFQVGACVQRYDALGSCSGKAAMQREIRIFTPKIRSWNSRAFSIKACLSFSVN